MAAERFARDRSASPAAAGAVESTTELIERARAGDIDAANCLFARFVGPLTRWASGRLPAWARDIADTDDLVQDTLLRTFKRIDQFEPRGVGALHAYLRQAILNRVREELRRRGRQPAATSLSGLEDEGDQSPLEQAMNGEAITRYQAALARLTAEQRDAIIGRVEFGYTYHELAAALAKPTADAARKTAQRALLRLAEEMARDQR